MSGVKNESTAVWLAAATAFANFLFTFVAIFTVERFGRRKLALASTAGVFLTLAMLAITFYFDAHNSPSVTMAVRNSGHSCFAINSCNKCLYNEMCGFCYLESAGAIQNASCVPLESYSSTVSHYCSPDFKLLRYNGCPSTTVIGAIAVTGMVLYVVCFAPGLGPVPYVVTPEIFPLWARSTGVACAMSTGFLVNLLIAMTFLHGGRLFTEAGWFGLSAGFALLGWIFIYFLLPETKGKRLEHMREVLSKSNNET